MPHAAPSALVLTAAGTNCESELAEGFALAGAEPRFVHLHQLMRDPDLIDRFDLIGLPGGFSYGDAVAAGRIAAQLMRQTLYGPLVRAIGRGVPIIAPCNGFQIAVQMGLLPGPQPGAAWPETPPRPEATLAQNESARFVDRWCAIEIPASTRCVWTHNLALSGPSAMLPVAHGEGRFVPESEDLLQRLEEAGQIAVRYAPGDSPSGSVGDIAGICDASGLVFGLMPHPERFTRWDQHPFWTRLSAQEMSAVEPPGLQMFRNAVRYVREGVAV